MKAFLKNNRQSARKVRLIANFVRGKNVVVVLTELSFMPQKGAHTMKKLIASAAANARQAHPGVADEQLIVKTVMVDEGVTYTRYRPRAFGRAAPINRECSHIRVELAIADGVSVPDAAPKSDAPKEEKPAKEEAPAEKESAEESAPVTEKSEEKKEAAQEEKSIEKATA